MAARCNFGSNWWARRWLEVLESFGWESRLQRGRTYARRGNVLSIDLAPGTVKAKVQGSRPRPYTVKIKISPLTDRDWERVITALAGQAAFAARLLAGEMPEDIETAFAGASLSLFPASPEDIETSCSCPDWANPCKHIAAVYYLLGEKFDGDPFLLFLLRGRDQEALMAALRERRVTLAGGSPSPPAVNREENASTNGDEPANNGRGQGQAKELPPDPVAFWRAGDDLAAFKVHMAPPAVPRMVLKRLGPPPLGREAPEFYRLLESYYEEISRQAYELAFAAGEAGEKIVSNRQPVYNNQK
ncbi:SWIM zinc finger family protein [Moorella naiadis]|uniref:SWIM zinc finger family protein n=1 Tax=Moorella naiadis (nom. illeg.) TaxID=3093670 RepID=UPI003D9C8E2B